MSDTLREQKMKKKRTIMDAALELFMKKGVQKTSIDEIVRKSCVAKGTFYLYFQDKVDLSQQLFMQLSKRILLSSYDKVKADLPKDYVDMVISLVDTILEFFVSHQPLLNMIERNFSWPLLKTELMQNQEDSRLQELRELLLKNPNRPHRSSEEAFYYVFSIVALCGSVAYPSIIHKYPAPIETMKPVLYDMIRSILYGNPPANVTLPEST